MPDELDFLSPEEYRTFRAYARSSRALFVHFDRELRRELGMPRAYFEILWLLYHAPGRALRMNDLADATGSQPSRITHAVTRLEEQANVRRELCRDDRRGWNAVLTETGAKTLKEAAPYLATSIRKNMLDLLSPPERASLTEIGERVLDALDQKYEKKGDRATLSAARSGKVTRNGKVTGRTP